MNDNAILSIVLGAPVVAYVLGVYIGRALRMKDHGWKIGVILATVSMGAAVTYFYGPPKRGSTRPVADLPRFCGAVTQLGAQLCSIPLKPSRMSEDFPAPREISLTPCPSRDHIHPNTCACGGLECWAVS